MTHAKAIFFGEHAVVYGYKGITIPLPEMQVDVTLKQTNTVQQRDKILDFIANRCDIDKTTEININSTIPVGRGLGSSAALSVAIARSKNITDVKTIANDCEKFIHGNPSGIDVNQVLSDSPLLFSKKDGSEILNFSLNSFLLIIDTGVVGITKKTLKHIKDNFKQYKKYIDNLGKITDEVIPYLKDKNIDVIGEYMYESHKLLQKLGVSHKSNDEVVEICKKNNAKGAKLTGGGAGGCCICLSDSLNNARKIQNSLKEKGYNSWIVTV
ncbi:MULTISPECIES: mevalonate kinase [Gemella]|uniref:mevalonate kinase n=1 Tax=Gemella TaxID=1378 RepID=UPI00076822FE|nr:MULTISPECIES: mevalonate kinase [Gemella]AME09001.1 mevalonate kinase [Gemella sp. oral taxon 928]AXI26572.1 mevalonate kinase [Gemella sp. ND 6198]